MKKPSTRYAFAALTATALIFSTTACKKVDEKSSDTMGSASSGVMTNTAGMSGTQGQSAAAQTASDNAATASAPMASSEAPVAATPSSMASAVASAPANKKNQ